MEEQQDNVLTAPQPQLTKPKQTTVLGCRVEATTYERWLSLAHTQGLTPSELMRKAIEHELVASQSNPQAKPLTPEVK
jgi:hypothetical protein